MILFESKAPVSVKLAKCAHCDEVASIPLFNEEFKPFCCQGCLTVYTVLHSKGLEDYYAIKERSGIYRRRSPVEIQKVQYRYMDEPEFIQEYTYRNSQQQLCMEFYLEGIHCLACLWLIEKLPFILPNVLNSKLDIEKSVVTVSITAEGKFSEVAQEFNQLGYRPHPLKRNQDSHDLKTKEERMAILRIGVAAAGASNIMLYAVSNYAGAQDKYAQIFNALSILFALPVMLFSAWPFYKSSWQAIKTRTISIDVPIAVSLLLGLVMGLYNLSKGIPENYLDSLTALVFLLLLSRYFLRKIQERALSAQDLHFFYQGESVLKAVDATWRNFDEIHPKFIAREDILKIPRGEFIPADGRVLQGRSHVNASLLTGESLPVAVNTGDWVFAGTQNLSDDIIMKALKVKGETRLGDILKSVEQGWSQRAQVVELTDRISKYFISAVFALAVGLFAYLAWLGNMQQAIERALTLLIVTCPCALALAVPLTFTRALGKAADQGIIIKNDSVIQKLSQVKRLFLDKTGTLTYGRMQVVRFTELANTQVPALDVILSLEGQSKHPVARALVQYAQEHGARQLAVSKFVEHPGIGVEAEYQGQRYTINRQGFLENGVVKATFDVADRVRSDSREVVDKIRKQGIEVSILSGDKAENVQRVAAEIGLENSDALGALSPEQKNELVKNTPRAMMVGDGANDAIALTGAYVGVAVLGAMDIALRAADIYLSTPGLAPIEKVITMGHEAMKVIYRNLVLSLIYNSVSVLAAFMGWISPLTAAIIMPVSSLTVLISTLYGTKPLRCLWKS